MSLQSLIRTAEQLKIKGLCEINDQTAAESDTEVIYPPHKKIRTSRHYESHHNHNNNSSSSNKNNQSSNNREESIKQGSSASHSVIEKDAQPIASQDTDKRKSKSPIKDIGKNSSSSSSSSSPTSPSNQNQSKNMASLEMGMVSINLKFHKCLIASFVDVVVVVSLLFYSSSQLKCALFFINQSNNKQNGNVVMGVPLTYMDFAPEPPAPTATPVITTEVNCTPSHDTKDLSSEYLHDDVVLFFTYIFTHILFFIITKATYFAIKKK